MTQEIRQFRADDIYCATGSDGCLGRGNFGCVRIGFHDVIGVVAVKCFPVLGGRDEKRLMEKKIKKEIRLIQQAIHPNVVQVLGWTQWAGSMAIIMEYISAGNLNVLLLDEDIVMTPLLRLRFAVEISSGIAFIHNLAEDKRLTHGDLKPENVIVSEDLHCKITDFGGAELTFYTSSSSIGGSSKSVEHREFTQIYAAPEHLNDVSGRMTTAKDVYSFGLLLFMIATRRMLVKSKSEVWLYLENVKRGVRPKIDDLIEFQESLKRKNKHDDAEIMKLLASEMKICWQHDPSKRPRMTDVRDRLLRTFSKPQFTVITMQQHVLQALQGMQITRPSRDRFQCVTLDRFISPNFSTVLTEINPAIPQPALPQPVMPQSESLSNDSGVPSSPGKVTPREDLPNQPDVAIKLNNLTLGSDVDNDENSSITVADGTGINGKIAKIESSLEQNHIAEAIDLSKELITLITMHQPDKEYQNTVLEQVIALSQQFLSKSENLPALSLLRCALFLSSTAEDSTQKLNQYFACSRALFNVALSMNKNGSKEDVLRHVLPPLQSVLERVTNVQTDNIKLKEEVKSWCEQYVKFSRGKTK